MASEPPSDDLTLQEVADELGVHYMTAYRYVRIGVLPARKEGRSWKVARADLEAMQAEPEPVAARGDTPWSERLARRLLAADEAGAWRVIEAALAAGTTPKEALLDIITPAMGRIGDLWADKTVGVDEEHAASAICLRLIGRLGARFARRGLTKGTVVLGTTEHELHGLPTAIVAEVLRQEGYEVRDLGPLVPPSDFAGAARRASQLVAVGVSATTPDQDENIAESLRTLRKAVDVPVFVGGAAVRSEEHAQELGADGWAHNAEALIALIADGT